MTVSSGPGVIAPRLSFVGTAGGANIRMADPMPLRAKLGCESTQALAGPTQGRLRVAALGRLDQSQQSLHQLLITLHQRLASTPRAANLPQCRVQFLGKLFQSAIDRARRNPSRPPYRGDPTVSRSLRLGRRKYSATSFVEMLRQSGEPLSNRIMINHHRNIRQPQPSGNPSSSENSKPIQLFPDGHLAWK